MHPLDDIANRARVLGKFAPDNANRLCKARESLRVCQEENDRIDLRQFLASCRHEVNAWDRSCREAWEMMNQLVMLVYAHLPNLDLELVRINPAWRYDDPKTDWPAIVAELRRIEDAALRKLLKPDAEPLVAQTVSLSAIEQNIVEAIGSATLVAREIAKKAGYPDNSNLRQTLANMAKRGILKKGSNGRGYTVANSVTNSVTNSVRTLSGQTS